MLSLKQLTYIDQVIRLHFDKNKPFGGKMFVLGGDFRQCLPIIKDSTTEELKASTIINSYLFTHGNQIKRSYLNENMRTENNQQEFARFLLQIGNGTK
uniref:ATP-dependent DNA helicase n=1 Tax=Strongyloides venezuelensis TaxID=75913 RepID=A0A0K0EYQ8_STRVS